MEPPSDKNPLRLNWPSIGIGAALGLIIAVAGPLLVSWFQSREPKLVYTAPETIPFQGPTRKIATYQVSIANDGRRVVEDVICVIRIPGAAIEQRLISPANLSIAYADSAAADSIRIQVPTLNPSEALQVSALASTTGDLPTRPEVALRGRGIVGELRAPKPAQPSRADWLILALTATAAVSGPVVMRRINRRFQRQLDSTFTDARKQMEDAEKRMEDTDKEIRLLQQAAKEIRDENLLDQRLNLSYLCRINGLEREADAFLRRAHRASYWSESDRLADAAAKSNDVGLREKVTAVLDAILLYTSTGEQSRAIILFNLSKIAISAGNEDRARDMLQKALGSSRDITAIIHRVALDPILTDHRWVKEAVREHPRVKHLAAATNPTGERERGDTARDVPQAGLQETGL